jgi:hypothetical protein
MAGIFQEVMEIAKHPGKAAEIFKQMQGSKQA